MQMVLAMNSGAEAVETAIKAARRWGYQTKGIAPNKAEIICMENNFAGRTISILSFSSNFEYRQDFGPFTPGFTIVPFGDARALRGVIKPETVAVLVEPIQGEAGILIPPDGFLREVRKICDENKILMLADEIQTGLCRTGKLMACDHENVRPDLCILGKSLGGGITPISAVVGSREVLELFQPGSHGSTFGGNPFACAIAREVIKLINEELPHERAAVLGARLLSDLRSIRSQAVAEVRGRGLMIGIDIAVGAGTAKDYCKKLKKAGLLCKDTRPQTLRLAPPLIISDQDLKLATDKLIEVLSH
jgi:ornithine--oxo-acid transaminase